VDIQPGELISEISLLSSRVE